MADTVGWSKRTRALWRSFGVVAKDARIKVILYPLLVVFGVILTRAGDSLWTEYGPGPIYLTVHVKDNLAKPVKGSFIVFSLPKRGGHKKDLTDLDGTVSFEIDHSNKGSTIVLGVFPPEFPPDHYKQLEESQLPRVVLDREVVTTTVELQPTDVERPAVAVVYRGPGGYWEKIANEWTEHSLAHPEVVLHFQELRKDSDYIYLVDRSRTKDGTPDNPLLLRLPIKGGTAQWSWSNPAIWIDLTIVTPQQGT